jgi:hypothetical protein
MIQTPSPGEIKKRTAIVAEYGGINPYQEVFYIQSILTCAKLSMAAFNRYAASVIEEDDHDTFYHLQDALTQAAAISRYFWPSKNEGVQKLRAERLRQAFLMTETSPLKDRQIRNAMEHFDERLDKFLLSDPMGQIIPGPIVAPHHTVDEVVGSVFRLVDPWELIIVLFGEKYSFMPIYEEVERILILATKFDGEGGRLRIKQEDQDI